MSWCLFASLISRVSICIVILLTACELIAGSGVCVVALILLSGALLISIGALLCCIVMILLTTCILIRIFRSSGRTRILLSRISVIPLICRIVRIVLLLCALLIGLAVLILSASVLRSRLDLTGSLFAVVIHGLCRLSWLLRRISCRFICIGSRFLRSLCGSLLIQIFCRLCRCRGVCIIVIHIVIFIHVGSFLS